jgi:hypothetical protein
MKNTVIFHKLTEIKAQKNDKNLNFATPLMRTETWIK